jgi:hypothetical protein
MFEDLNKKKEPVEEPISAPTPDTPKKPTEMQRIIKKRVFKDIIYPMLNMNTVKLPKP